MAGYAYGLDDGGAIPDNGMASTGGMQEDNSGALPVEETNTPADNSGAPPVAEPEQQQQPKQDQSYTGTAKRIIQYLMGGDAAPPEVAQKFAQGVKAEVPNVSDDDANLIAVHKAGELGGPAAAWAMIQYNRTAYNAKQSFAKAALNGVDGKQGDIQAAAQAATQASQHVLDGSQTIFTAQPHGGVTATVRMPGTDRRLNFQLSPQQFSQWLDVGKDGLWDKVMEDGGVPGTLQKIAQAGPAAGGGNQAPSQSDQRQDRGTQPSGGAQNKSVLDLSGGGKQDYTNWNKAVHPFEDPELERRAQAMFPGNTAAQSRWMAGEETRQQELENKINVAKEQGTFRYKSAEASATGRVAAAHENATGRVNAATVWSESKAKNLLAQAQLSTARMMQQHQDREMSERGRNARAEVAALGNPLANPEKVQAIMQKYGVPGLGQPQEGQGQPPAPQPQPASQQAQPAPQQQQRSVKDQQAIAWANANPANPWAAQIKQRLGIQ